MSKKLAMAKRCQLLTGSWEGNRKACPCIHPDECHLTEEERDFYKTKDSIKEVCKAQWEEFNELKETG